MGIGMSALRAIVCPRADPALVQMAARATSERVVATMCTGEDA
jgi:hypothetical protein